MQVQVLAWLVNARRERSGVMATKWKNVVRIAAALRKFRHAQAANTVRAESVSLVRVQQAASVVMVEPSKYAMLRVRNGTPSKHAV
jgi:hypothetical protein